MVSSQLMEAYLLNAFIYLKYGCDYANRTVQMSKAVSTSNANGETEAHVTVCGFSALSQIRCSTSAVNSAGSSPTATVSQLTGFAGTTSFKQTSSRECYAQWSLSYILAQRRIGYLFKIITFWCKPLRKLFISNWWFTFSIELSRRWR